MTTTTHQNRKTFASVSAANSGGAIGFLFGAMVGFVVALNEISAPGLSGHAADWASNFLLAGLAGAVAGISAGALMDRTMYRRDPS